MPAKTHVKRIISFSSLCLTLSGCFHPPYNDFRRETPPPTRTVHTIQSTLGSAAAKLMKTYDQNELPIIQDLEKNDIQFLKYGDTMTLVIPVDHYYQFDSPKLNDICYEGLNNVVKLLQLYPCSTIYVAAFTDNVGPRLSKKRLSQAQAETMLTFLWANNIHAVRLKAEGYGDQFDIADNHLIHGSAENRRIEIQWVNNRYLPKRIASVITPSK